LTLRTSPKMLMSDSKPTYPQLYLYIAVKKRYKSKINLAMTRQAGRERMCVVVMISLAVE
jgi:hypothetical protein